MQGRLLTEHIVFLFAKHSYAPKSRDVPRLASQKPATGSFSLARPQSNVTCSSEGGTPKNEKALHLQCFFVFLEAPPRIELGVKVLQTSALPLGYGAE